MTINFPKFPNNRSDKNRPIDPNMTVASSLDDTSVDGTLPTGDNPAHNRTYQDMLTQTDQLQSDTLTEAQRALLKKRLKSQALPTQKTKSLPLMPILLGLILLAGGGVLGYMYQAYTQPPAPAPAPIATKAATPATPPALQIPASGVAGNTVPVATPPTTTPTTPVAAVPTSDKPNVTVVSNPASPAPATKPSSSDGAPMPSPTNVDGSPNTSSSNNATTNLTTPAPTAKPVPTEAVMPANAKPTDAQPAPASDSNASAKPSNAPAKNTRSYDDFVKSSENTVFIEPPNHK